MKSTWVNKPTNRVYRQPYIDERFNYLCPAVKIKISNFVSGEKTEMVALLDTGFDGMILITWKTYTELKLEKCQLPDIFSQRGVTVSGGEGKTIILLRES